MLVVMYGDSASDSDLGRPSWKINNFLFIFIIFLGF